jgi:hypothetical protein
MTKLFTCCPSIDLLDLFKHGLQQCRKRVNVIEVYITPNYSTSQISSIMSISSTNDNVSVVGGVIDGFHLHKSIVPGVLLKYHAVDDGVKAFHYKNQTSSVTSDSVGRWYTSPQEMPMNYRASDSTTANRLWNPKVLRDVIKPQEKILNNEYGYYFLSDNTCYKNAHLPFGSGLIGAWTPFVTGHPFTFFFNNQLVHSGIVGIQKPIHSNSCISNSSIRLLGNKQQVSKAQGNIILEISNRKPTDLLIDLMKNVDTTLYAVVSSYSDSSIRFVSKITSGDPSTGFIALDSCIDLSNDAVYIQVLAIFLIS